MAVTITQLQTRILNEANKTSATYGTMVNDLIVTAIKMYERRRFWFLEKTGTVTLNSAAATVAAPSDFKAMISLMLLRDGYYYGEDQGFTEATFRELRNNSLNSALTGYPREWALLGNTIYVDRLADQNYTLRVDYIKGDATYPASGSDTSVWFEEGVDLIRVKTLAMFWRDVMHNEERAAALDGGMDMNGEGGQVGVWLKALSEGNNTRRYSYGLA